MREPEQTSGTFRYADTHEVGNYMARLVNRNPAKLFGFAVNIDPAEVEPATTTRQELQARFGKRPLLNCESPADLADTIRRLREGTSLWEWFLTAVLIALVLEVFLANRGALAAQPPVPAILPAGAQPESSPEPTRVSPEGELRDFLEHLGQDSSRV